MGFIYFLKYIRLAFIGAIFSGLVLTIYGQQQGMVFSKYTKSDGISDLLINCMLQDKQGFLWIGTWNGLNRFDGNSFKVYKSIESDSTTLISDGIKNLLEDNNGRIWIICHNGLNYYDKKKDRFVRICLNNPINGNYFTSLAIDSAGILWVGTFAEGLWSLSLNEKTDFLLTKAHFKKYQYNKTNKNSLSSNSILGIFVDHKSNMWINASNSVIDQFRPKSHDFSHYTIRIPDLANHNYKLKLQCEDSEGIFWFTTSGTGLISWDKEKDIFTQFRHWENRNSVSSDNISHIRQDKKGILWISTDGEGLSFYNKKTGLFSDCKVDPLNPSSISSNALNFTFQDWSGVIWAGTYNLGLNKYESNQTIFRNYKPNPVNPNNLSNRSVTSVVEDKEGNLWIGTDGGGLNCYNRNTNKFTYFFHDPKNSNSLSSNAVVSLEIDYKGNIWIGTYLEGLNYYDRKQQKFFHYKNEPNNPFSISHNNIWAIKEDSRHYIWIGTIEGTLNLFDPKTKRFYRYTKEKANSLSFIGEYTTHIFEDSRNNLWISTSAGLEMLKLKDFKLSESVPKLEFIHFNSGMNKNSRLSKNVFCAFEDRKKNIWIGANSGGLYKWTPSNHKLTAYTEKDGLPNNSIKAIIEDDNHDIWISTENGISKFSPDSNSFTNYDVSDGLQDYYFSKACCKTSDGSLIFGGPNGFNIFNPREIPFNSTPPQVILTDFKITNNSIKPGQLVKGKIVLNNSIFETKELSLSYKINNFSFEFAALDFNAPKKNRYAYKMEGFENQWRYTDFKNRVATYTNLDPGNYVFKVIATNNDGVWNKTGTTINITILPPWWETLWFRALILVFVIACFIMVSNLRTVFLRRREKELTFLVKQRTADLELINEQLISKNNLIKTQANHLRITNGQLMEQQTRLEEQSEEINSNVENLKLTNELLVETQKLTQSQAEKLEENNKQLTMLNATKDRLFSIIAHDLRNPFQTISGFSELLLKSYNKMPEEKLEKFLGIINSSSETGYILLENLLQWSRSQTGTIFFDAIELNLLTIVEENNNFLEGQAQRKNITIQTDIGASVFIKADENMVKTILRNIVSNAIKFTPDNGIIMISSILARPFVEITVSDSGIGIAEEKLKLLFKQDTNFSTQGTAKETGTGLGLILCKEFVEKHRGTIRVESSVGKGSKFIFTLPLS
jgi:signal transduction histidine kinase/ligand-binding sensor domain-containing protein